VSKQDTHFLNVFSLIIGLLIVIALGLLALARLVGTPAQLGFLLEDAQYIKNVRERVQPFARVAVAGQDNSKLKIEVPTSGTASAAPALPKTGKELFEQTCSACHAAGIAGAPKAGDAAAWGPRIAKGKATLYEHALKGFQGSSGLMPAKGGRTDASDDLVQQAVDYMVSQVK
jgi:cytochrome c5